MNRVLLLGAGALALAITASACSSIGPDAATVNGTAIKRSDFEDELRAYVANGPYQEYLTSVQQPPIIGSGGEGSVTQAFAGGRLQSDILYELIHQQVVQRGLTITPDERQRAEAQAKLRFADAASADKVWAAFPASLQKQFVDQTADFMALSDALGGGTLTDAQLQAIYDQKPERFGLMCARHILVPTEEQADALHTQLVAGADFATVAQQNSTDSSAADGGKLYTDGQPCPSASTYDPAFVDGALSVPTGQLTEPVHTQFGWHLILVDKLTPQSFDQVKDQVATYASNAANNAISDVLRQEAKGHISVDPKYGSWDPVEVNVVAPGATTTTTAPATTTAPSSSTSASGD